MKAIARVALPLAVVCGLVLGPVGFGYTSFGFAALFAALGIGQLLIAAFLTSGLLAPGKIWGWSAMGQVLHGTWCLIMACMPVAGEPGNPLVLWLIGAAVLALFVMGAQLEGKAREEQQYV